MTEFEINKKVAEKLGFQSEIRENGAWLFNKIWIPFDPCNEPGQAMPIIIENLISLTADMSDGGGSAWWCASDISNGITSRYKSSPLRAAMEVFLMMKDKENNND